MDPRTHYYHQDAYGRRRIFRTVSELARTLITRPGLVGVQISGPRNYDRDLTTSELRRLGDAIREAKAERIDQDNARMAARLGLAA